MAAIASAQNMQGIRRGSEGSDSDAGSFSSTDALTSDMLTMTSRPAGQAEENEGPAQKQVHVPDVSAGLDVWLVLNLPACWHC